MIHAEKNADELATALALPVAGLYRDAGFQSQTARSLCGPTSVFNVLRSLGEPVERATLLDGTGVRTAFGVRFGGMTLDQLADVVRAKSGRRATVLRGLSLDDFRSELQTANDPERRYIANLDRGPIFGWGGGHHSPIGGYLAATGRALVLDTNRRVGPWLVSAERLHGAVTTIDPSTRRQRGLLRVE